MKKTPLATMLAIALTAGCAGTPERDLAWEIKPHMDVRHGMKQVQAQYQLGRYFQGQGRDAQAENAYRQALAMDPAHVESINALATLLAARGELDEASRWFEKLVAQAPDRAYLHNNAGYALFLQGRHAEAVAELRTAVGLDPRFERAWINLERAARAAGMTALAEQAAQRGKATSLASAISVEPPASAIVKIELAQATAPERPLALSRELTPPLAPTMISGTELAAPELVAAAPAVPRASPTIAPVAMRELPFQRLDSAAVVAPRVQQPAPRARNARAADPVAATLVRTGLATSSAAEGARLEISNANGVRSFAGRIAEMLKADGLDVRRINNYQSFDLTRSLIEYRPGFEAAAKALANRIGIDAVIAETAERRWGSDVRVILGGDATRRGNLRT